MVVGRRNGLRHHVAPWTAEKLVAFRIIQFQNLRLVELLSRHQSESQRGTQNVLANRCARDLLS